jgi:hypothetical protein
VLAGCVPVFFGETNAFGAALHLPEAAPAEDWLRARAANETDLRVRRLALSEAQNGLVYRDIDAPGSPKRTAVDAMLEALEARRLESRQRPPAS